MAAYVVDDLGSGFYCALCRRGVEGVDGEDRFGLLRADGFDDGEDAVLLFVGQQGGGVGTGGFAADVEDVGSFGEHLESLGYGSFPCVFGSVEVAAIGERVGCDVEDAHDEGLPAEGQGSRPELPLEALAGVEGHGWILKAAWSLGVRG